VGGRRWEEVGAAAATRYPLPATRHPPPRGEMRARNPQVHDSAGVRFERPPAPVLQTVEHPTVAAWNAAAEEGSLDLGGHLAARRARTATAFRDGLDPAHYVALTRARLQTLFGPPSSRGDDYKSSFQYDLVASTPAGQVYFLVGDHKASEVLIFWEYSTSTPEARRIAEQAFWALISAAAPSDYEDVFAFDDAAGVRYGYGAGRAWVVTIAALPGARKPSPLAQPTGRVSLAGIVALATGALAAVVAAGSLGATGALAVGLLTWIVASVGWQARSGG
jgi:hypothetical protein